MRFSDKKTYRVTAKDKETRFIASITESFSSKAAVLYWAKNAAANAHKTLAFVQVFCEDDNEVIDYLPSGKVESLSSYVNKKYKRNW